MLGTSEKHYLFNGDLIFGNKKKSAEAESGAYGVWGSTDIARFARNCETTADE
jgi:hypothetical protein